MIKNCVRCGSEFETTTKKLTCSEICRTKKILSEKAQWRRDNKPSIARSNQKIGISRRDSGKQRAYQLKRRSSKAGYTDRFLERIRTMHPASDVLRSHIENLFGDACAVTGVPFKFDRAGKTSFENPYAPSIDRISSKLPYQIGNIQIVLSAVNFAKSAMDMDEFTKVWRDITKSWLALTQGVY